MTDNPFPYKSATQEKNLCWMLPRPKPDKYKGGMPLYGEDWLLKLSAEILGKDFDDLDILNVFCGMNKHGFRVDVNEEVKPDLLCDVHEFAQHIEEGRKFDVILADPPYSTEEARDIYGTPPLKYKKWTAECDKVLKPNGLLIVYHKFLMKNPDPKKYFVEKRVSILNRTGHLGRIAVYFRKKEEENA